MHRWQWVICLGILMVGCGVWLYLAVLGDGGGFLRPVDEASESSTMSVPAEPPVREPVELVFIGDIMLDRDVWDRMGRFGLDYPFRKLGDLFAEADLVVGNLEGPITDQGSHALAYGNLLFRFDPSVVGPLQEAGIDAVSLANNHTLNQGETGLAQTRDYLEVGGIAAFGDPHGVTVDNLWKTSVGEWQLAFIGWNQIETRDSARETVLELIRALEADPQIDAIIILPHWGSEYRAQSDAQISDAHSLIEAGADLVIGAHPHVVQGVEIYQDRLIAYSLGNFIFDQYWSQKTQEGLAIRYRLVDEGPDQVVLSPLVLPRAQPSAALSPERQTILSRIVALSHPDRQAAIEQGVIEIRF